MPKLMKCIASRIAAASVAVAVLSLSAFTQQLRGTSSSDTGDFTEGNLKFHRGGGFIQVSDTEKKAVAGTIIVQPGGALMFAPMPGYDIKSAYEKHMSGVASAAEPTATAAKEESTNGSSAQRPSPATGFDAASKTVTLSGGRSVTFTDSENAVVRIPNAGGVQAYDLHYHKASAGSFAQVLARHEVGRTGMGSGMAGPLAGGVTITAESAGDGLPSGKIYDTLEGGNLASRESLRPRVQPIMDALKEASEVVKPIEPKLAEAKVVKTLLNNNLVQ